MKQSQRWLILIGCLLLVAVGLWLRFWRLDLVPPSLYHDEMDNAINGAAWARWGSDLSGAWSWWPPRPLHTLNYMSEWGIAFFGLVYKVVGTNPAQAAWPAAVFGVLSVLALMWLVWRWFLNRDLALWSGLLLWLNPWHIHISRWGYETTLTLFWQILAVAGGVSWVGTNAEWPKLSSRAKKWRTVMDWVLVIGGLLGAFFTYHAAKFTTIAIAVWLIGMWLVRLPGRRRWWSVAVLAGLLVALLMYAVTLQRGGAYGQRAGELIFSGSYLGDLVNSQRRLAVVVPMASLWTNKLTVAVSELSKRYFFVFDPSRLWGTGMESGYQFSLIIYGFFLFTSLPLLLWGAVTIGRSLRSLRKNPWTWWLLLLFVSPVATAVTIVYQSISRSALTYVLLVVVVAAGAATLTKSTAKRGKLATSVILFCLAVESVFFGTQYFSRYPVMAADNHYWAQKLLVGYWQQTKQSAVVMVEKDAYNQARSVAYYSQQWSQLTLVEREQFMQSDRTEYMVGHTVISLQCQPLATSADVVYFIEPALWERCHYQAAIATMSGQIVALGSPIDSRTYFYVWPDKICQHQLLPDFIHPTRLSDFDIFHQSISKYCSTWVMRQL